MTTPLETFDAFMPWADTAKFPDTVLYRRAMLTKPKQMPAGVTDIQITWTGTAALKVFCDDATAGTLVSLDGLAITALTGKTTYLLRANLTKPTTLAVQGISVSEADTLIVMGLRYIPIPTA